MQNKLFRQAALNKLSMPDQLDRTLSVTSARGWITLVGLVGVVVGALVWGTLGSIPTLMPANGILIRQGGLQQVKAPTGGQLTDLQVKPGDVVKVGQTLATLKAQASATAPLTSPSDGTVVEVSVATNGSVQAGANVITLELTDKPLQAVLLVPLAEGKKLKPGIKAQINPTTVNAQDHGYLIGIVSYVSELPVSQETLLAQINNTPLVQTLLAAGGARLEVVVDLQRDTHTPSGYRWSTPNGPNLVLSNGTMCITQLVIGEQSPLTLILPFLHDGNSN